MQYSMSKEKEDEYKESAKYMIRMMGVDKNKPIVDMTKRAQLLMMADQSLKSGLSASELSKAELNELELVYGKEWYKKYNLKRKDVPKSTLVEMH